ncbi:hypothetical protein SDC9_200527 [bioreactor metagenome]|uniref:Uncharacterized protein n=1 Tax=bioreactor metagenome TaxID=1076179 RepID=A0A645IWX0_9ZZZZ
MVIPGILRFLFVRKWPQVGFSTFDQAIQAGKIHKEKALALPIYLHQWREQRQGKFPVITVDF